MIKRIYACLFLSAALLTFGCGGAAATQPAQNQSASQAKSAEMTKGGNPIAIFETNMGVFKAELFSDKTPLTAGNFITLAKKGFYDGLIFHRVIDGFMIQGGDPQGNGTGGPGYTIKDEFHLQVRHDKYVLSMANAGPDTGGSQFFITLVPTPWLDGKHSIFGRVTDGAAIVDAIGKVKTDQGDRPLKNVIIKKITIVETAR